MVVRLLLSKDDINPNFKDNNSRTPLSLAIEKGHDVAVTLLLAKDSINLNSKDNNSWTPLLLAIEKGRRE